MRKIKIGNRMVGDGEPTLIIAEAGINHNGKLELAKKMIDVAADAGADIVKFQTFRAKRMYPKSAGKVLSYIKDSRSVYDIVKSLEMPYEWIPKLIEYCNKKNIIFLTCVCDNISTDKVNEAGAQAFKITSYECTDIPLIGHIAEKGKPIIMSVGMASMEEIENSVNEIYFRGNKDVLLMHCVNSYPAPFESINALVIKTIKEKFQIPTGLSDHTIDPIFAPCIAVSVGANLIEKHFTLDKNLHGPDQKFAIEPHELKNMIKSIRDIETKKDKINKCEEIFGIDIVKKILGSNKKKLSKCEKSIYMFARRCIFSTKDISKNMAFTENNIAVLRAGNKKRGMEPKYFNKILGKKAKADIKAEEPITWDKIE